MSLIRSQDVLKTAIFFLFSFVCQNSLHAVNDLNAGNMRIEQEQKISWMKVNFSVMGYAAHCYTWLCCNVQVFVYIALWLLSRPFPGRFPALDATSSSVPVLYVIQAVLYGNGICAPISTSNICKPRVPCLKQFLIYFTTLDWYMRPSKQLQFEFVCIQDWQGNGVKWRRSLRTVHPFFWRQIKVLLFLP